MAPVPRPADPGRSSRAVAGARGGPRGRPAPGGRARGGARRIAGLAALALVVAAPGRVAFGAGAYEQAQVFAVAGARVSGGTGAPAAASTPPGEWLARRGGDEVSSGAGSTGGVDEAATLASAAQDRLAAGEVDEALALWRRAYALLPRSLGYAQRRAAVALAIAGAEEAAFRAGDDPGRLRAGIAALDTYLAGLDPTDDENRAAVEGRRATLSDMLDRAARPQGPTPAPGAAQGRRGLERRSGLAAAGLAGGAVVGGVVAIAGALASRAADRALARAAGRPCDGSDPADPCGSDALREALKAEALADGLRANRIAVVGSALAGVLLAASAAALIAGGIRGRAPVRATRRGATFVLHF